MSITTNPVLEPLLRELSRLVESYTVLHNSYTVRKMSSGDTLSSAAHIARLRAVGSSVDMEEFSGAFQELCDLFAENDPGFWARLFDTLSKNGSLMQWILLRAEIAAEDLTVAVPEQNVSAEDLRALSGKAHDLFRAVSLSAAAFGLNSELPSLPYVTEVKKGAKRSDGSVSYTLNIPEAPRKKAEGDMKKYRVFMVLRDAEGVQSIPGDSLAEQCRNLDSELTPSVVFTALEKSTAVVRKFGATEPLEFFSVETRNGSYKVALDTLPK